MSYTDLCTVLRKTARIIGWFAMSEAVVLQTEISGACHTYELHPDDRECKYRLVELVERSQDFLRHHKGPETQKIVQELNKVLVSIKLEGIKE